MKRVKYLLSIITIVSVISILGVGLVKLDEQYKSREKIHITNLELAESRLENAHSEISRLQNEMNALSLAKETVEVEFQAYRQRFDGFEALVVQATAYEGDTITATGTVPKVGRTISVDPKIIPLGSEVYIEGFGWRIAEDVGGKVKGNIIDIFMANRGEAISWGRRNVKILMKRVDNTN